MKYGEFAEVYDKLVSVSGRLEKTGILSEFLKKIGKSGKFEWIYLVRGRVLPDYDMREFGISTQIILKVLSKSFGASEEKVVEKYKKIGDLGQIAEELSKKRKQSNLFMKEISVEKVFDDLKKIVDIEGKGAVGKKLDLVMGLLGNASGREARYIVRTLLGDLRIGVADGLIRDAIAQAYFGENSEIKEKVGKAHDLANDFAVVFEAASKGEKEIEKIKLVLGRPFNVMLAIKAENIEEAFKMCGRPAAFEYKYDGFRMVIHKVNGKIFLFTRKLEDVTKQFPDVVEAVEKNVIGENFVLDSEIVGYDSKTKKYKPFEAISQRIKRKHNIDKLIEKLPVEINVFDVLYYNGKNIMEEKFKERRKLVEKIIKQKELVIRPAVQIITDDEKEAEKFYKESLRNGEEGIMVKNIEAGYNQGRKVGYLVKMKPDIDALDLVIIGAEYGTGKRGGWLSSYIVACKDGDEFKEVGKVSSGLKEIEGEEGTTYEEMSKLLKPLITKESKEGIKVKPKIVVSVIYQNIQRSPSYDSGYALRFPRIKHYRPEKKVDEICTLEEIKKL